MEHHKRDRVCGGVHTVRVASCRVSICDEAAMKKNQIEAYTAALFIALCAMGVAIVFCGCGTDRINWEGVDDIILAAQGDDDIGPGPTPEPQPETPLPVPEPEPDAPSPLPSNRVVPPFVLDEWQWSMPEPVEKDSIYNCDLNLAANWAVDAEFKGAHGKQFQRFLIQDRPHTLDIMAVNGKLGVRMCNGAVWWTSADGQGIGTHTKTRSNHMAFSLPVDMRGDHKMQLFHDATQDAVLVAWDGVPVLHQVYGIKGRTASTKYLKVGSCNLVVMRTGRAVE